MATPENPHSIPRRTSPTWEVELLISGVAVLAMLQLPGRLDDAFAFLRPRLDEDWFTLWLLCYMYLRGAALILACTFVLHLLLRARWIALVGLHSVYPQGICWERLRLGPVLRSVEEARSRPFAEIIERADNRATVVFAAGVLMALFVVVIAGVAVAMSALTMAVRWMAGTGTSSPSILVGLVALAMLPFFIAMLADRKFAARWPVDGRRRRLLARVFAVYTRLGFSRNSNPAMALLGSHAGDRKVVVSTVALLFTALGVAGFSQYLGRAQWSVGSYTELRPLASEALSPSHYDDQRDPLRDPAVPYIPSRQAGGPYLALVIPYVPRHDRTAFVQRCGALLAAADRNAEAVACLAARYAVGLDGSPVTDPGFQLASDPRSDRPALLSMIDVRGLSAGRHELTIATERDAGRDPGGGPQRIVFWR